MNLSVVKQSVYEVLKPQTGERNRNGKEMDVVEARLNVMHLVFLAIQMSTSLDEDILLKGQKTFQTLFNRYFTSTLEVFMWGGLAIFLMYKRVQV